MKTFDLYKYEMMHQIQLEVCLYQGGNLAITMTTWETGEPEPWNTLTVNLAGKRKKYCAFIDTNNNGMEILTWIAENNLGAPTGHIMQSGFCSYPEYYFSPEVLEQIDSDGYAAYDQNTDGPNQE